MFKNDERYWNINLLNKWFAISSVIFLVCTVWIFVDDNDDEFKEYQFSVDDLESFTGFKIKIVSSGTNEAESTRFKDLRVIALA